ncbi:hypothetical protein E3N88_43181 [Mikania micrantha]|uniref:Uncharacterized protein n=1 Tax=Mikania micrantha TaxID=192012 RepID=A0A5N6LFJ8_9ASTR|nr:hypothetical protein E3N88_43181 [Mikania micrantha]
MVWATPSHPTLSDRLYGEIRSSQTHKQSSSGEGTGLLRLLQDDLEAYSCNMGSVYTEDPKSFLLEMAVSHGPNLSPWSSFIFS